MSRCLNQVAPAHKSSALRTTLVLWALLLNAAAASASPLAYLQPTNYIGGYSSQNDTKSGGSGNFALMYDNFTLGQSTALDRIDWVGSYFNPPSQGAISSFRVDFWNDLAGQPGSSFLTLQYSLVNVGETFLQNDNAGDPTYSYRLDFLAPVDFNGGTQYWVSVQPNMDFPPQWGWESASGGDLSSYQDFFGIRSHQEVEVAFSLYGNPTGGVVPEPGSLSLLGLGLAGAGLAAGLKRRS